MAEVLKTADTTKPNEVEAATGTSLTDEAKAANEEVSTQNDGGTEGAEDGVVPDLSDGAFIVMDEATEDGQEKDKDDKDLTEEERQKRVAKQWGESPDNLIPFENIYDVCQGLFDKHLSKAAGNSDRMGGTRMKLNGERECQVELLDVPKKHLRNPRFMVAIKDATCWQFKFNKKGGDKGFVDMSFATKEQTADAAIKLRTFSSNVPSNFERFRVHTFYGKFEQEMERERRKKDAEERKKRDEDRKKREIEKKKAWEERQKKEAERRREEKEEAEERAREEAERKADLDARSLYVDNLADDTEKEVITKMFPTAQRITLPTADGKNKGHVYLEFESESVVDDILDQDNDCFMVEDRQFELHRLPLGVSNERSSKTATKTNVKQAEQKPTPSSSKKELVGNTDLNTKQEDILRKALQEVEKGSSASKELESLLSQVNKVLKKGDKEENKPETVEEEKKEVEKVEEAEKLDEKEEPVAGSKRSASDDPGEEEKSGTGPPTAKRGRGRGRGGVKPTRGSPRRGSPRSTRSTK